MAKMMIQLLRQFLWALKMDAVFLFNIRGIPIRAKIYFVVLKYIVYLRETVLGSSHKISHVRIFHDTYYYTDPRGLASLQRVYCESYGLKELVKNNTTIIDIGAHTGQFHFFCRHYLNARRVISVEPIPSCFEILKLNSAIPHDCINAAISRENEPLTIYIPKSSSQHSSSLKNEGEIYEDSFSVVAKKLDEIIDERDIPRCHLLKIDTEGSEYDVLLSAKNSLEKTDLILVEMSVYRPSSGNLFTVGNFLQDNGFKLVRLLPDTKDLTYLDGLFARMQQ